jgi:outer membrane protein assembly factor BamD
MISDFGSSGWRMVGGLRIALLAVAMTITGCAQKASTLPPGSADADKFLFDRGSEAAKEKKWLNAREYFRNLVDNYPQSPFRPDAKLALGDTYIGEDTTESLLLAANEFREFLTFYPTHARADYAQLQLTRSYMEQMLAPERDQTATQDAIKEIEIFLQRFPNSKLMPEARKMEREAKDRLSEANYRVGFYYFRVRWYPGAIERFKEVLSTDPNYTHRDAVYFHLAESLYRSASPTDEAAGKAKKAEALPYYERLIKEFEKSEYLPEAQKRVAELKAVS